MTPHELLRHVEALGIRPVAQGEVLFLRGPIVNLAPEVLVALREAKPEILEILRGRGPWWAVLQPGRLRPRRRPGVDDLLRRLAQAGVALWKESGVIHILAEVEPPADLLQDVRLAAHALLETNLLTCAARAAITPMEVNAVIRKPWLRSATPETLAATRERLEAAVDVLDRAFLCPGLSPYPTRLQDRAMAFTRALRAALERVEGEEFGRSMTGAAKKPRTKDSTHESEE